MSTTCSRPHQVSIFLFKPNVSSDLVDDSMFSVAFLTTLHIMQSPKQTHPSHIALVLLLYKRLIKCYFKKWCRIKKTTSLLDFFFSGKFTWFAEKCEHSAVVSHNCQFTFSLCGQDAVDSFVLDVSTSLLGLQQRKHAFSLFSGYLLEDFRLYLLYCKKAVWPKKHCTCMAETKQPLPKQ